MKRNRILLCLLVLLCLPMTVLAAPLGEVMDNAGVLTVNECSDLNIRADEVGQLHNFGVYVLTLDDYTKEWNGNLYDYTEQFYEKKALGNGTDHNGVILSLSMADHDYALVFYGPVAAEAFTESGRDELEQRMLPYFRQNDYVGGFTAYLDCVDEFMTAYEAGRPVGSGTDHSQTGYYSYSETSEKKSFSVLFFAPGLLAAVITGFALCAPMKSAKQQRAANSYATGDGLQLTVRQDVYLRRTVTRRPKPKPSQNHSSRGSGGGSHHHSSSHSSGRSGKF